MQQNAIKSPQFWLSRNVQYSRDNINRLVNRPRLQQLRQKNIETSRLETVHDGEILKTMKHAYGSSMWLYGYSVSEGFSHICCAS